MKHSIPKPYEPEKKHGYDKWELEDALRTLQRAKEIVDDPKLMAAVTKLAGEQAALLNDIPSAFAGLRKLKAK